MAIRGANLTVVVGKKLGAQKAYKKKPKKSGDLFFNLLGGRPQGRHLNLAVGRHSNSLRH